MSFALTIPILTVLSFQCSTPGEYKQIENRSHMEVQKHLLFEPSNLSSHNTCSMEEKTTTRKKLLIRQTLCNKEIYTLLQIHGMQWFLTFLVNIALKVKGHSHVTLLYNLN
jgi:hypothetical protein